MEGNPYQDPNQPYGPQPAQQPLPPAAQSIKDLVRIAGLIALIFGIINILWGIAGLIFLMGIVGIIFGIIDIIMWKQCDAINKLIDQHRFEEAKSKTLVWMILGIILGGLIPGIILLIAYLKFDELRAAPAVAQAPPPPPPV